MSGEAGDIPGLDPASGSGAAAAAPGGVGGRLGGLMVGFGNDRGGATYAALDLGTNNCRLSGGAAVRRRLSRRRRIFPDRTGSERASRHRVDLSDAAIGRAMRPWPFAVTR